MIGSICIALVVSFLLTFVIEYNHETGVIKTVDGKYVAYRQYKKLIWGIKRQYAKYYVGAMTSSSDWADKLSSVGSPSYCNSLKDAIAIAEAFNPDKTNAAPGGNEIVWRSSDVKKKNTIPTEEELTLRLGNALIAEDKELELKTMAELKQYKYI